MLTKQQIKIELIKRTPYQLRKIDINEPDIVVKTLTGNITCWQHNDITSSLTIKLPSVFNAEYSYVRITEPNDKATNWFVLGRLFHAPNVWTLTLKRDVIRENWDKIKNATCEIERGYVNSSNPLFYKEEGITGNLTLGKRSKLLDSNLILAYVKTFESQNNNGAAIPEGFWKVQAGTPGYNNAPIISENIPSLIRVFDCPDTKNRTAYIKMGVYHFTSVILGGEIYTGHIDSNGNYDVKSNAYRYVFNDPDSGRDKGSCFKDDIAVQSSLDKCRASLKGYTNWANDKLSLNIVDMPSWVKKTGGFGDSNKHAYPETYECVINKGSAESPEYYKLTFKRNTIVLNKDVLDDYSEMNEFISYSGQNWSTTLGGSGSTYGTPVAVVDGQLTYHEYRIEQLFLSNTAPTGDACYTEFPTRNTQITSGAYAYNIFAFKVFDNGVGFNSNYASTAQANSGQMIASALMGTGKGQGRSSSGEITNAEIPSLAGQIVDLQMCPFDEESIKNIISEVFDINAGAQSSVKVGEYYLLNSQDVETFIDYDLNDWQKRGNKKSRNNLSQMRLVCPNNSSMATLNPDIMVTGSTIRFKVNGTLYPYKPVYKVTPIANTNIIYSSQDARDNMLVLGGDFSATQVSNGWSDYMIGNKNVEEAQQASIANQTLNQQLQYEFQQKSIQTQGNMATISALLGIMGGLAGLTMNNPLTTALGLVGGGIGLLNTQTNMQLNEGSLKLSNTIFANNLALNQKLFNLQMGNIKALPNTIHKITNGSFDNDYSIIVEEYYSTEEEYTQFDKVIRRTGMSLDCIGKLIDYIHPDYFVFGQMIECDVNNFNIFDEVNKELQNGLKINYSVEI